MYNLLRYFYFIVISFSIIITGCDDSSSQDDDRYIRKENEFWAANTESRKYYIVTAPLYKDGKYCKIHVEESCKSNFSDSIIDKIISEFDDKIYPVITAKFGDESDVDGNGKIILLVLDIKDKYKVSGEYTAGYFDSSNTFVNSKYNPHSNESDIIYLDCNPANPETKEFLMTAAHEFQHLINFTQKGLSDGNRQDTWINEGLSSAAEYIYSGNHLTKRINYYNQFQVSDSSGNNFFKWGNELIDYSTVYLFFQWIRIHSVDGDAIYKDILNSSYTDYRAVVEQAKHHLTSYYNSIDISNSSLTNIMIDWLIANQINQPSGKLGYGGEIASLTKMNSKSGTTNLYPHEGVIKSINGLYYPGISGTNIIYRGLSSEGMITSISAPYSGDYILAINTNPLTSGNKEKAELPFSIASAAKISAKISFTEESYATDMILGEPGTENSLENYNNSTESDNIYTRENSND